MDGDLYDEFGNYIGPEIDSESEDSSADEDVQEQVRFYFTCQAGILTWAYFLKTFPCLH